MRRVMVILVVLGALVVVLLGWRSLERVLAQRTCFFNGGSWNAAEHRCEPQPAPR
jgi:hypothetical protein